MSKIGKINIPIPDKVKVLLSGNIVNIEGPLGKKSLNIDLDVFDLKIDEGKEVSVEKQTILKISGPDKQLVGMVASQIKSIRPPEPYKGKGIKEQGQYILRKEGKKK